jgi:hypothetical protein
VSALLSVCGDGDAAGAASTGGAVADKLRNGTKAATCLRVAASDAETAAAAALHLCQAAHAAAGDTIAAAEATHLLALHHSRRYAKAVVAASDGGGGGGKAARALRDVVLRLCGRAVEALARCAVCARPHGVDSPADVSVDEVVVGDGDVMPFQSSTAVHSDAADADVCSAASRADSCCGTCVAPQPARHGHGGPARVPTTAHMRLQLRCDMVRVLVCGSTPDGMAAAVTVAVAMGHDFRALGTVTHVRATASPLAARASPASSPVAVEGREVPLDTVASLDVQLWLLLLHDLLEALKSLAKRHGTTQPKVGRCAAGCVVVSA